MSESRWSVEQVLDFCNRVREAGGARPLAALMPGVPADTRSCLVARNLNFECEVNPAGLVPAAYELGAAIKAEQQTYPWDYERDEGGSWGPMTLWVMAIEDEETRDRIADALGLERTWACEWGWNQERSRSVVVRLTPAVVIPEGLARVAQSFDEENLPTEFDGLYLSEDF